MTKQIISYDNFVFEAEGVNTKIEQAKFQIAKVLDEVQLAKDLKKNKPNDIAVEIDSIKKQAIAYGKLPALLNDLATHLAEKSQLAKTTSQNIV